MAYTSSAGAVDLNLIAGADLSAKQFHFVELSADNTVTACNALTDTPIGVLQNKPESGETAVVRIIGVTKVVADEAVTYGALIGTSADGQADIKAVDNSTGDEHICGRVIEGASSGALCTAVIQCAFPVEGGT